MRSRLFKAGTTLLGLGTAATLCYQAKEKAPAAANNRPGNFYQPPLQRTAQAAQRPSRATYTGRW